MKIINDSVMEEVKQWGKKWTEAIIANDAKAIGGFMSDDWVIVGTEGGITGKEVFLDFIRSGDLTHHTMNFDEIRIRHYENTVVITSRGISAGSYKGEPFSFYEWSTDLFVKENEQWKCVLTMLTPAK